MAKPANMHILHLPGLAADTQDSPPTQPGDHYAAHTRALRTRGNRRQLTHARDAAYTDLEVLMLKSPTAPPPVHLLGVGVEMVEERITVLEHLLTQSWLD